jgi:hypothetical protein
MIEGHIIFNGIIYAIVIAYILYINFAAYYQTTTGFLKALVNIFQNWIFRTVFLLFVGFFALDIFKYGGFVLAILLTIAFLNTNMLIYKQNISESFEAKKMSEQQQQPVQPHNLPPPPSAVPLSKPSPLQIKDKKLSPPMPMQPPVIQPAVQPAVQPVIQQGVQPYNIKPTSTQSQKMNSSMHQEISE